MAHLFDPPAKDPWRAPWDDEPSEWTLRHAARDNPTAAAQRIGRLFADAGTLLRPYSDEQVGHGLTVLVDPGAGGDIRVLTDHRVPIQLATAALEGTLTLYAEVFGPRLDPCSPATHSQRTDPKQQLSQICFMFWDVAPLDDCDRPRLDAIVDVLERTLRLESTAAQWAALHGLGHRHYQAPGQVEEVIDHWLARRPHVSDDLQRYARQARTGRVN